MQTEDHAQPLTPQALAIIRERTTHPHSPDHTDPATALEDRRALLAHLDVLKGALDTSLRVENAWRDRAITAEGALRTGRVITTEQQLNALGVQSVIIDSNCDIMHKVSDAQENEGTWAHIASESPSPVHLPALVVIAEGRATPCQSWSRAGRRRAENSHVSGVRVEVDAG